MKKRNKWLILGAIAISSGALPMLVACGTQSNRYRPSNKDNQITPKPKVDDNTNSKENDKVTPPSIIDNEGQVTPPVTKPETPSEPEKGGETEVGPEKPENGNGEDTSVTPPTTDQGTNSGTPSETDKGDTTDGGTTNPPTDQGGSETGNQDDKVTPPLTKPETPSEPEKGGETEVGPEKPENGNGGDTSVTPPTTDQGKKNNTDEKPSKPSTGNNSGNSGDNNTGTNTSDFNSKYSLREEVYEQKNNINVSNISSYNKNDPYFGVYNEWLNNKTETNYTNEIIDNSQFTEYSLLSDIYSNRTLTIKIKSNVDIKQNDEYKLIYKYDTDNKEITLPLTLSNNSKRTLIAKISNIDKNYKIRLVNVTKNNENINFTSKGDVLLGNESWLDSSKYKIENFTGWTTWPTGNGNNHTFNLIFQKKDRTTPRDIIDKLRFIWITKDKEIQYAGFSYQRKDDWNRVVNKSNYAKVVADANYFDVSKIDKFLGLEILVDNNFQKGWVKVDGIPEIKINGSTEGSSSSSDLPTINSIQWNDNNLGINFSNIDNSIDSTKVKFEIKSMDPFSPFSKVYTGTKNGNQFIITNPNLPKDISKFMLTRVQYGDKLIESNATNTNMIITNHKVEKNFNVEKLNFYLDSENKNIYGSIGINFTKDDYELFKNKNLEIVFERKGDIGQEKNEREVSIYRNLFLREQKVVVPFSKLQKFNLNGFYENTEYQLKSVKIVDKNSLIEFINQNHFRFSNDFKNKTRFLYNFNYQNNDNNYISGSNTGETKNSLFEKVNESGINVDYSIQNHYALNNFNRELWYKQRATLYEGQLSNSLAYKHEELNKLTSKVHLTQNNQEIQTHFISPREIVNDLTWKINDKFTEAKITKDISVFNGIDAHENDAYFEIGFEFDPKQRQVIDLIEPEPFVTYGNVTRASANDSTRNMSKSFVYLAIPYKELLTKSKISNVSFEYLAIRNSKEEELKLKQLIASRYQFDIEYNNSTKELTYIIKSKNDKTKIFDRLGDHYLSINNSTFLGNSLFFAHWADLGNNPTQITYVPKQKPNILSVGLNQLNFKDSYVHTELTLEGSSKRVYFGEKHENVLNARERAFNFAPKPLAAEGTWDVIGKVTEDPNDYRYYITTNQHVWGAGSSKEFKNNNFNLPLEIFEPAGGWSMDKSDPSGRVEYEKEWTEAIVKVDLIANFHNDAIFPNSAWEFRNNYGDINDNSTWGIFTRGNTSHSLSNADLIVGIADFKDFFNAFDQVGDVAYYNGRPIDQNDKAVMRTYNFFKKLPTLKNLKPSRHNLHVSRLVNLNWSIASFPIQQNTLNKDSFENKRYREYIIGSMADKSINELGYGGARSKLPSVPLHSKIFDLQKGSSGSMVFDSEGNPTGLLTETESISSNVMMIDTNSNAFLGDGKTTQNPGSFYERMRLLSYLFPNKYSPKEFTEMPNWEKLNNE
ncbi:hypothetical protein [Mycoplasma sp. OR1901]|uniref:hypothetical protein n=1 Tax=Mycoplasma sp. OR1901 TaxID=2742195 RepID=UPI0015823347|nr:hypothetical protein [Mycoplasma sp. OR1901]QKT05159.1 hypothetical protein HTZ87_00290 [Mycoplasma sp. OR1901]